MSDRRDRLTLPGLLLLLVEIIVVALLGVASSRHFGVADGMRITVAYLVAYLVPLIVLKRARGTSMAAHAVLLALFIILVAIGFDNMLEWTKLDGYSLQEPNLKGDARGYYKWALNRYDGRIEAPNVAFPGFPLLMVYLWNWFGLSVVWPLAVNTMFTLTSVVMVGMTTRRLLSDKVNASPKALLLLGMALSCFLNYYLVTGISILKEATLFFSFSLAGFVLSSLSATDDERFAPWRDFLLFSLACILIALVRTTYLYFVLMGALLMVLPHWRHDWIFGVAVVAEVILLLMAGNWLASYSFNRHAEIVSGGWNMQHFFITYETEPHYHIYQRLLGYYFLYSPLHKMAMLPLTMSVQYMIPFPWMSGEEPILANYFCRITYGWYAIGGLALFYFLFFSWRRGDNIGVWPWWPALAFGVIAYVVAGSVTRYVLPFQPLFVPVAVYVLCRIRERRWRRAFIWWAVIYVIVVAITLLICTELQHETISQMLHTRPLIQCLPHHL